MPVIIQKSQLVYQAITYIEERLSQNPSLDFHVLIDEAGMHFNLSPREAMDLEHVFRQKKRDKNG